MYPQRVYIPMLAMGIAYKTIIQIIANKSYHPKLHNPPTNYKMTHIKSEEGNFKFECKCIQKKYSLWIVSGRITSVF